MDEHFDLDLTYITERIIGKSCVCQPARKLPIDLFLQLCLVTWPLNESEALGDLVMITDPKKNWIELLLFKRI